jgi:signal transduction histidine kinase
MANTSVSHNENQDQPARDAQEARRTVFNAIELALSLGDFQKQIDQPIDPQQFIELTAERIDEIIRFDMRAVYFVDQTSANMGLSWFSPTELKTELEDQFEQLIDRGYVAWALKEQRGVTVYSKDGRYRILMHVIATYSRIRGLFIGLVRADDKHIPDGALQALSLLLRNAANALESLEYIEMFKRQNAELHVKVDQKVSELRQRDTQLLNAQKMDAIATLAGGVAHQYNNALFAMTGNLDLLRLGIREGQNIDRFIDHIDIIVQKMKDLTLKLLAYARGGKYMPKTISINKLVEEVLVGLKKTFKENIELILNLPSEPHYVHVDETQIQLALSAIVINATEALEKGGRITVEAEAVKGMSRKDELQQEQISGDCVAIKISDNGPGMDETTRQRIFEPFFTTKFQGRGLSMAAVYGIVNNHHGSITVDSEIGSGTTVHIYLPVTQ